ncbi:reverse transcriptase-like protein [Sphingomonas sp. R-74633]|uniref:reverse transcriptase-like protein n=1 Tax=Sphingomonas sp. R-74633 TaxID=2751188 RepID=UPI00211E4B83|nr:reverse transcriptase-like protein [Sphingomonas sp. R-74633]
MKLFFDGGCRPAPIGMELALVVRGQSYIQRDLGPGTAMDAEWLALIAAMRHAYRHGLVDAVLLGDALAVIAQANGQVRCPPSCVRHMEVFRSLPRPAGRLRIRYLKRTQNLAGIALAALHGR